MFNKMFLKIVAGTILWLLATLVISAICYADDNGEMKFYEVFLGVCVVELAGLMIYLIFGKLVFWCFEVLAS